MNEKDKLDGAILKARVLRQCLNDLKNHINENTKKPFSESTINIGRDLLIEGKKDLKKAAK